MAVAKIIEITATSGDSFEDAIREGIDKASQTVHNIKGAWVKEQKVWWRTATSAATESI